MKTILIPTIKVPNGENFSVKIDDYSFYVMAKNGSPSSLVAKSGDGKVIPVIFHVSQNKKQAGNLRIEENCEACVQVEDDKGNIQVRCYPIACNAAFQLNTSLVKQKSTSLIFPKTPVNGIFSLLKDDIMEIKATYSSGIITDYTITSFKNEKVSLEFETSPSGNNPTAKASVKCFVRKRRTLPDGSVISTVEEISCDKLPKPKNPSITH